MVLIPQQRHLVEKEEGEYGGVSYTLTVHEERGVDNSEARYVEIGTDNLRIREKWREGLHDRLISQYFTWLPYVRGRPLTKEEHVEKVMDRFKSSVDEYNEFKKKVNNRNGGNLTVVGDGVMEVTLGERGDN